MTDMVLGELDSSTSNVDLIIEVGPHTALGGPIQQILALPEFEELQIPYFGCLVRKTNAADSMQTLAAGLLQEGYDVKIEAVNFPHGKRSHVKVLTELPSYPWNHQIKHWAEPRFNKAIRERSVPPHDLLGSLVEGSNPTTPSWRHILRISESPWTRDHVIQSNILYPAAGYICLAIEAISQHSTLDRTTAVNGISGYRLRDVEFLQALMIPDSSDGIEIQTTMRPVNQKDIGVEGWKDFEVWSVTSDNRWTQHAKGLIMIELESANSFNLAENNSEIKGHAKRIIPADLFANLRALGIAHGPMFQNMKSIVQSGSDMRSIAVMSVPDVSVPNDLPREHVIHPVTLDSVITAPYSAVRGAAAYESTAKVPRSIKSFWVSSNISHEVDHLFRAHSLITHDDTHGMEAEVYLSNDDGGQVVLEMKGFSYQSLGQNVSFQQAERWEKELCSRVGWSPDISIRSPATFELIKEQLSCKTNSMEDAATKEIWRVCIYFIQQAVRQLTSNDLDGMEVHYTLYYAWMKEKLEQAASGQLCAGSADWLSDKEPEKQHRIEQVAKSGVDGEMVCRLGAQLVDIMRAEVTLVDLMAQDDLLSKYNSETPRVKRRGSQVSGLLGHLVHKNPRARILEIGAGKGVMTRYALEALGTTTSGGPQASSYHYTDTSAASFDLARETFSQWEDLLSFDVLDIGLDPVSQGFTGGAYDIVIASHVLSATKSISRTLNNLKSLLKQGGVLLFTEDVPNQIDALFVKGLLPNWWSSEEDERKSGPLLSTPIWDRYLQVAGFSGADFEVQDCESTELCSSTTVMSTLTEPVSSKLRMDPEKIVIVTSKKAGFPPTSWLELLQQSDPSCVETDKGKLLTVKNLECNTATAQWYADKICIFVGEMNEPILYDLDSSSLEGIRVMSTNCKELVWVTRGGAVNCERPELSLAPGFIRSLRGEYVGRKFLTLDLDPRGPLWSEVGAGTIARVVQTGFGKPEDGSVAGKAAGEFEYAERNGIVLIPRFHHYVSMDKMISSSKSEFVTPQTMSKEPFYQPDRPMCLDLESLAFTDISNADAYFRELPASLLEVEPRAYGMSLHATNDSIMGLECAGIVTRVGSEAAENGYAVGNRVLCVLDESSLSNRVIVKWTSAAHIPAELSFQEAASIPEAFLTAFYSLIEVARLQRNQSVLIHAGAGSVGQAAIMVAQHLGAVILTTVGSLEERDLVIQKYGIPNSHIFDNNNTSFVADVLAVTRHNGVDAVLNSLRGALLQESFKLVAQMGCFIEVGKHDLEKNNNLEMGSFARHISFSAVDLPILLEHRASEVQRCLKEIVGLFEAKAFLPVYPLNTYAISDIAEVSDALKTVRILGKTVLSVGSQDMVPVLSSKPAVKLSADASYLIVGGNGGLGQSVAHWMVSRGARNIVLLSRSALTSEKTAALAEELKEAGCSRVLLASGDVASEDDLNRAIRKCAEDGLPPIRGVIHAAFVLRVSTLPVLISVSKSSVLSS
jgi:NADPH:quinone reductase-like Zn-dependent oxidoreductase/SAM-dependent methyltransferase